MDTVEPEEISRHRMTEVKDIDCLAECGIRKRRKKVSVCLTRCGEVKDCD